MDMFEADVKAFMVWWRTGGKNERAQRTGEEYVAWVRKWRTWDREHSTEWLGTPTMRGVGADNDSPNKCSGAGPLPGAESIDELANNVITDRWVEVLDRPQSGLAGPASDPCDRLALSGCEVVAGEPPHDQLD